MIRLLRRAWREQRPLLLAFLVALILTVGFAIAEFRVVERWTGPGSRDPEIAGWMTPRYVAHSWQVPPQVVAEALSLDRGGTGKRVTLRDLARDRGVPLEQLVAALETAIARHRDAQ